MHHTDVPSHAAIVRRLRECVENHRRVMAVDPELAAAGDLTAVLTQLEVVEQEIQAQGEDVQKRLLKQDNYARLLARGPRALAAAAGERRDSGPSVHVERFDLAGRRVAEAGAPPPLSGNWNRNVPLGRPRRKQA